MGLVNNSSRVPIFISSLKVRIHTAGIKNSSTQGASSKYGDRSAKPESRMLKFPPNTQRNSPLITKNTAITKYPMVLEKKELISRFIRVNIQFQVSYFMFQLEWPKQAKSRGPRNPT